MTQTIVDAVTRGKLCQLDHPAELLDEEGRVLGRFLPTEDLAEYEPLEPRVSEEELDERSRLRGGRPFSEILCDLEKRS